jgi:hypothetical protein
MSERFKTRNRRACGSFHTCLSPVGSYKEFDDGYIFKTKGPRS